MRYFEVKERTDIGYVMRLTTIEPTTINHRGTGWLRSYVNPSAQESIVDYLMQNQRPMVSDNLRKILDYYEQEINDTRVYTIYKGAYEKGDHENTPDYYFIEPRSIDAVHEDSVRDHLGNLESLILDQSKLEYARIFCVKGLKENRWFITLEIAEMLFRNHITGFTVEEIETR
ncbi:hypothetical protein FACS189418_6040 [Clostridia bacterium]|nr:hypothetical protein FACS189418_6040 [Clostridia bacterium]